VSGAAEDAWASLDSAWTAAFEQAWEALRTGNIAVGACLTAEDGTEVLAARNRTLDRSGPPGQVWGSSLAHAEINVLTAIPFRHPEAMTVTTTLQPCIQCAAAIRLAPVAKVRFAGPDRYWDGCHEFGRLSPREAARIPYEMEGPLPGELGIFATLISRLGPGLQPHFAATLRSMGEGPLVDLAEQLTESGEAVQLATASVAEAFGALWPRLRTLPD
jgi:tRNA(Arg) A34 adenosine deaminase TadA